MGCGEDSTGVHLVMIGMALAVLASVGSTFGLILQKLAQVQNDALPPDKQYTKTGAIICSPTWMLGFVLLIAVPFPLDLVAFSLAPQSLVVPLTGVTLILNQVIAPFMLKEKVSMLDWIATGVIAVGIIFTTAFGSHCSYEYTVDHMLGFFEQLAFQVAEVLFVISMVFCWWWVTWGVPRWYADEKADQMRAVAYGYMAGAVGGQQQIFLKATGELLETSINGAGEWDRWESWMLAVACFGFAVAQIQLLNKGLALWTAVKYLPIYNVCLILCSTTYGSIFYQEYKGLETIGYVMFPIGVTVVVAGSMVLTLKNEQRTEQDPTVLPEKMQALPEETVVKMESRRASSQGEKNLDNESEESDDGIEILHLDSTTINKEDIICDKEDFIGTTSAAAMVMTGNPVLLTPQ